MKTVSARDAEVSPKQQTIPFWVLAPIVMDKGTGKERVKMYVGRMVAIGKTRDGNNFIAYRLSSRSYPNREIVQTNQSPLTLSVVPKKRSRKASLPYVHYQAMRATSPIGTYWAIAGNGDHVELIAGKISDGTPVIDAIGTVLVALGHERDKERTPRIVGLAPLVDVCGVLATVREDALIIKEVRLSSGRCSYLATYDHVDIRQAALKVQQGKDVARYVIEGDRFRDFEHPIATAAMFRKPSSWGFSIYQPASTDSS